MADVIYMPHSQEERGARLKKLRLASRWYSSNQRALAERVGYTGRSAEANLSRIENGERPIPKVKSETFAKVLATDPDLVDDWRYILAFLTLQHSDFRGCIAHRPRWADPGNGGGPGGVDSTPADPYIPGSLSIVA